MSETDKAMGRIEAGIEGIHETLKEIKDGRMAICQLHTAAIEELQGRPLPSNGKSFWGIEVSRKSLKAVGLPSLIIACAVGWGVFQHIQTRRVASETKTAAAIVAKDVAVAQTAQAVAEAKDLLAAIRAEFRNEKRGEP